MTVQITVIQFNFRLITLTVFSERIKDTNFSFLNKIEELSMNEVFHAVDLTLISDFARSCLVKDSSFPTQQTLNITGLTIEKKTIIIEKNT